MRLFIAEKPSLARAIADVLPGPHKRAGDCIECGAGDVVAWCAGHILETASPEEYDPAYKDWRLEHLPIVPKEWKHNVTSAGLLKTIKTLLKSATRVVHAGDPDREGQLLVDEVIAYLGYRGPVDRVLISDLSPDAVRKAISALEPNQKYRPLSDAALARQRADWLWGMNMTRLYTLLGRNGGYDGVLSVGRVQTPLLGLIAQRDIAIETFRPAPYYVLIATVAAPDGSTFLATWQPGASVEAHLDDDKRLLRREVADDVRSRTEGKPGSVIKCVREKKTEPPPLPYSLADLQMDAAKRHGMSAQQVLDACQRLYETHRIVTYPRSDCSFLPEGHLSQASQVLAAIKRNAEALVDAAAKVDTTLRSRAWNDKKITAHHALIPTPNAIDAAKLSQTERLVYELVARRYLVQFLPPCEFLAVRIELDIAGEAFLATGRQTTSAGWKLLTTDAAAADDEAGDDAKADEARAGSLPALDEASQVKASAVTISNKETQPPKPFTDASIIQAMCNIARYVSEPGVKKILSEADGIGTPATRAAIIETLFERGFIERKKKAITATPTGRALVKVLPDVATTPDMTAVWEAAMRSIQEGAQPLDVFLSRVTVQLGKFIEQGRTLGSLTVGVVHPCTKPGCDGRQRRVKGSKGHFWSCIKCRATSEDAGGKPAAQGSKPQASSKPPRRNGRSDPNSKASTA